MIKARRNNVKKSYLHALFISVQNYRDNVSDRTKLSALFGLSGRSAGDISESEVLAVLDVYRNRSAAVKVHRVIDAHIEVKEQTGEVILTAADRLRRTSVTADNCKSSVGSDSDYREGIAAVAVILMNAVLEGDHTAAYRVADVALIFVEIAVGV